MPTYVYRCKSCGHQFEAWQHMTDDPLTTCPQCGASIHRVVFPTGILFKGSGFYSTDSRKSAATGAPGSTDGSTPEAPAAKTDANGATGASNGSGTTSTTETPASTSGATKESKSPAPATTETKS